MKHVLREYMNRYEIPAKSLSEKSGVSKSTLSRYLSGSRVPEPEQSLEDTFGLRGRSDCISSGVAEIRQLFPFWDNRHTQNVYVY